MFYRLVKAAMFFSLLFTGAGTRCQVVPHTNYTSKDGLIADRISVITQDNQGMLWFGSYYGICRYNGQGFENISLPSPQQQKFVTSILPLGQDVYAGFLFNGGLCEFSKGKARPLPIVNPDKTAYNDVTAITNETDSSLIVVSKGIVYSYSKNKFTLLLDLSGYDLDGNSVKSIVKQADQSLWLASSNGLFIFQKQGAAYTLLQHELKSWNVFSLYKTPSGTTWMEAFNQNTTIVANCRGSFASFRVLRSDPSIVKVPFSSNSSNDLWGADWKRGLFSITPEGHMTYYPHSVNLNTEVAYIYADRENNIWIANEPGVSRISLHQVRTFYFDEIAAAGGFITIRNNGDILASNSKNLYHIRDQEMKRVNEFRSPANMGYMGSFVERKANEFWCYRWEKGIWKFKLDGTKVTGSQYFSNANGFTIEVDALAKDKEKLWAGGINKFYCITGNTIRNISLKNLLPSSFHITSIAVDSTNNRLFLGDNTSGIFQLKYQDGPAGGLKFYLEKHISKNEGITDPHIRSLYFDSQNNLWAGTRYGGIYRIAWQGSHYRVTNYNSTDGIPCTRISGIAEEPGRSIWFSTCDGIHRYLFASRQWEHYDIAEGLPSREVFHIAIDSKQDKVWALTAEGVTAINYKEKVKKAPSPLINLTGIYVVDQPDSMALFSGKAMKYEYDQNSIRFTFIGTSFIDEKKVLYKYHLEGYSDSWSQPTSSNNVTFASLPPGHYTFEVLAANSQGTWSERPAIFSFSITQPFYQSIWFLLGSLACFCLAFYLAQNYRLRQKVRIEKLRMTIARDLHDDIGSALGSINILSKAATRKLERSSSKEDILGTFEKIGHSAQSTLESMDDIIWSINPGKDHWQDLLVRMKEFALPIVEAREIRLNFHNRATDVNKLSMQLRRSIFLVFKECITNAVKHSGCSEITVDTSYHNGLFLLKVTDNGKGFNDETSSKRNGIKNIIQRAHLLEGNVTVHSTPGVGTTIQFSCPLR